MLKVIWRSTIVLIASDIGVDIDPCHDIWITKIDLETTLKMKVKVKARYNDFCLRYSLKKQDSSTLFSSTGGNLTHQIKFGVNFDIWCDRSFECRILSVKTHAVFANSYFVTVLIELLDYNFQ